MAFDFLGGAGAGAADALQEIVARQFQQLLAQKQMEQAQQRIDLEGARVNETIRQNDVVNKRNAAADEEKKTVAGLRKRGLSNMAGVIGMGLDPETAKREIAMSALNADVDVPQGVMDAVTPPPAPRRTVVTTIGPKGAPIKKAVTDDELASGVPEYREPKAPAAASTPEQIFVKRNGVITPIRKGTAQPGDVPYDAVAERASAAGTNMSEEARATAEQTLRVAKELRDNPNLNRVFGAIDGAFPSMRQGSIDADSLVSQLTSLEALENMGKMKGVLSDKDIALIKAASTRLSNQRISEGAARAELNTIISMIEQKLSGAGGAPQPVPSHGGGGLAPGTERVINGTPAVWDGKGWLPK